MKEKVFVLFLFAVMAAFSFQLCGALALILFGAQWCHDNPFFQLN